MAINAFISFFDKANGESIQRGKENWVEIQGWDWEVEAATAFSHGGGASAGRVTPGNFNFQHSFDSSSTVILAYLCSGRRFPKIELQVTKIAGDGNAETYFTMTMEEITITKVSNIGTSEGSIIQQVQLSFQKVNIEYKAQDNRTGAMLPPMNFNWDIPSGTVSPSS